MRITHGNHLNKMIYFKNNLYNYREIYSRKLLNKMIRFVTNAYKYRESYSPLIPAASSISSREMTIASGTSLDSKNAYEHAIILFSIS